MLKTMLENWQNDRKQVQKLIGQGFYSTEEYVLCGNDQHLVVCNINGNWMLRYPDRFLFNAVKFNDDETAMHYADCENLRPMDCLTYAKFRLSMTEAAIARIECNTERVLN